MKRIQLGLIFSILILCSSNVFSQEDQSGRNSVVKFTPTRLLRGEILFSYERMIAEQASVEVSFGPAISNVTPFNLDHLFGQSYNASEKSLLGYTMSIGARYYPLEDKDALEGFYISPIIGLNQLNYLYSANGYYNGQGPINPNPQIPDQRGFSRNTTFAFVFGTQTWISKTFSLDMYVGTGLKMNTTKSFYANYNYDYQTNIEEVSWVRQDFTDVRWYLTLGIKVGIGFGKRD